MVDHTYQSSGSHDKRVRAVPGEFRMLVDRRLPDSVGKHTSEAVVRVECRYDDADDADHSYVG